MDTRIKRKQPVVDPHLHKDDMIKSLVTRNISSTIQKFTIFLSSMVSLNWLEIIVITIGIFVIGNFWFGPIFGKTWMRIHHGSDRMSESEMKKAMKGMWKLMLTEFIATFIMVMTLEFLIQILPSYSGIHIAFMIWLGFILPMTASNVIWGNDKKEWMCKKIAIASSYRLVTLLAAGYILSIWQ